MAAGCQVFYRKIYGIFYSVPSAVINSHYLELPLCRTYFHGSKGVRAIEVLLYFSLHEEDQAQIRHKNI